MFIAFAHRDLDFYYGFEKHLTILKRDGIIHQISSRNIDEENDWQHEISDNIRSSQIILFLVSADFLTSDYIISAPEVQHAFEQQKSGTKRVVPIIVRPVDWSSTPFAHLQVLPRNAIPATDTSWGSLDRAFIDIISGLRRIIEQKEIEEPEDQSESRYVPETIYPRKQLALREGIEQTQEKQKVIRCALEDEIEILKKTMAAKYGKLIRAFSLLAAQGKKTPCHQEETTRMAYKQEYFSEQFLLICQFL